LKPRDYISRMNEHRRAPHGARGLKQVMVFKLTPIQWTKKRANEERISP
jgi:hypothetical protein